MKTNKMILIAVTCLLMVLLIVSCNFIPRGVQNLFATKTATATATPTSTPTPTVTPLPPLSLSPCAFQEFCPNVMNIEDQLYHDGMTGNVFTVRVPYDRPIWLYIGWSTKNEAILKENLKQIEWVFSIDGQDYFQSAWPGQGVTTFENEPGIEYPGQWFGVILEDWDIGESHTILIGFELKNMINDGWYDHDAGMYVNKYILTAARIPTATPTNTVTPTATPTKTFTPRPTAVPYTKTPKATAVPTNPPCSIDSRIDIENTTGGYVTLDLSGPMKFHFNIAPGNTSLNVCSGSYTYKAWGCGGSSDTGSMNAGEGHKFICQ